MKSLHIRELEGGALVHSIEVKNESTYEKVLSGLLHRIDLAKFYVDESEFVDPEPELPEELKPKTGAKWKEEK